MIFFNILDIWMALNPDWNRGKLQMRWLFLEELGKALVRPQIQRWKDPSFCSHHAEDLGG